MNEHDRLVDRAAREARAVLFVGGLDSGKSSSGARHRRLRAPRSVAPSPTSTPTSPRRRSSSGTVGLKHIREPRRPHARSHGRSRRDRVRGVDLAAGSPLPLVGALAAPPRAGARYEGAAARRRRHGWGGLGDPRAARQVLQGGHARARSGGRAASVGRSSSRSWAWWSASSASRSSALGIHPAVVPDDGGRADGAALEESMRLLLRPAAAPALPRPPDGVHAEAAAAVRPLAARPAPGGAVGRVEGGFTGARLPRARLGATAGSG